MHDDIFIQLFFGIKKELLPDEFDYEEAGLEIQQAGIEGDERFPFEEFVGLPVGDGLSALNEMTDEYLGFDELEKTKNEVERMFKEAGVTEKVRMYIIQGIG